MGDEVIRGIWYNYTKKNIIAVYAGFDQSLMGTYFAKSEFK